MDDSRYEDAQELYVWDYDPPAVMARGQGRCSWCDEYIHEGDMIKADGDGGWKHADC